MPITTTIFIPKTSKLMITSIIIVVLPLNKEKIADILVSTILNSNGGPGRTRTDTVSLPQDFESSASTNSTTGPNKCYNIIAFSTCFINHFLSYLYRTPRHSLLVNINNQSSIHKNHILQNS